MLAASPAGAAPELAITEFTRDQVEVSRSDERITYHAKVKNAASVAVGPPKVGDTLGCNGARPNKGWAPGTLAGLPSGFEFEWRRNGALIPGESEPAYVTTAEDAGKVIQCVVRAINVNATAKAARVSLPAAVVNPQPATEPPKSADPLNAASRPGVQVVETTKRQCNPPTNWSGAISYAFQWLRNGVPIPGATENKYEPQPAGADAGTILQCEVIGTNDGGALVGISDNVLIGSVTSAPVLSAPNTPNLIINATASILELQLPGGHETFLAEFSSALAAVNDYWSCSSQVATETEAAKVTCTNPTVLAPQVEHARVNLAIGLGADAPDLAEFALSVAGPGSDPAVANDQFLFAPPIPFGIAAFETAVPDADGAEETQAGGHPFSAGAVFEFTKKRRLGKSPGTFVSYSPIEYAKTIATDTPRGFVGNALALPELCPQIEHILRNPTTCPPGSVVGGITVHTDDAVFSDHVIYALEPEFGRPAQFGFAVGLAKTTYTFAPHLRADDGYAITLESGPVAKNPAISGAVVTLCNYGAKTRPTGQETKFDGCRESGEENGAGELVANPKPLVTLPTRCTDNPPTTVLRVDSWENPGDFKSRAFDAEPVTGCDQVEFDPEIALQPTSNRADSPTGMDVELTMPTDGLEDPDGISQANLKRATVTLPHGMAVNASAGHGLGACTSAQVKMGTNDPIACPESSKIGKIAIETPLIREKLTGDVFIAKQGDNPFGSLIGLYMVFESKRDGILIKIAGKVVPDPVTGQMVVTFDENPEAPFSSVELHFPGGPRAALVNPPRCGSYEIKAELTPWNAADPDNPTPDEVVTQTSTYNVAEGSGGGPCPSGALEAGLNAGATNPVAGQASPFVMRLTREDGSDRFTALDVSPPLGMTAYLKGIPYCSDAALASISGAPETGQPQILNPTCPVTSLVGRAVAGAGAGPNPLFVDTGKVYLAGPYKGAPLSLAVVTPAVAGPLDLGNVVIRTALHINPETAQITAVSDPIPHILHGVLLNVRDIRVAIDRPNFTLNPTSCEEKSVGARVGGLSGASINLAQRFQVDNCAALGFKPNVNLRLVGGTKRGGHPSLRAVVRPRPGDANIRRAAVALPRSAFLDQANIRTICTRVQWANDNCPKAAQYGFARAWSPLLDQPLQGPVYLRSSNNLLPDLVADLRGPAHQPIKIEAAFRTDSIRGGIRSTIDLAPDAPVSRFVLRMQGGKRKGLIVNSRDICRGTNRANSRMIGHNGHRANARPKVHAANCGKARKGAKGKRRARVHRMQQAGRGY